MLGKIPVIDHQDAPCAKAKNDHAALSGARPPEVARVWASSESFPFLLPVAAPVDGCSLSLTKETIRKRLSATFLRIRLFVCPVIVCAHIRTQIQFFTFKHEYLARGENDGVIPGL